MQGGRTIELLTGKLSTQQPKSRKQTFYPTNREMVGFLFFAPLAHI
jgi:hypothetical protein